MRNCCLFKIKTATILALLLVVQTLTAQTLFNRDGRSARALGLGGAHLIASPDPLAAAWNPALLAALRDVQFALSIDDAFDLTHAGLAGFWPQYGGVGVNVLQLFDSQHELDRLSLGWGKALSPFLSAGLSAHWNRADHGESTESFTTASFGLILHPFGGRIAVSEEFADYDFFNSPLSPYRFAFSLQASDVALGGKHLQTYYKSSMALRLGNRAPSLFASLEWRDDDPFARLGMAVPIVPRFALYSSITDFNSKRSALGGAFLSDRYAFDLAYTFLDKSVRGGLSLRLGASPLERARNHYEAGNKMAEMQNYRAALRELRHYRAYEPEMEKAGQLLQALAIKVASEDRQIRLLLDEARAFELRHRYLSAALNYLQVLKMDRGHREARDRLAVLQPRLDIYLNQLYTRGVQAFEEGNYDVAYKAFENILLVRPDYPKAAHYTAQLKDVRAKQAEEIFLRGLGYYSQKNYTKAIADFEEAINLSPNYAEARENLEKARTGLAQQAKQNDRLFAQARRLQQKQQYLSAYNLYRQILDSDPSYESARQEIKALQGRIDEFISAKMQAGERAFQRGDLAAAEDQFQAILKMSPGHREANNYRQRITEAKRGRVESHMRNAMSLFDARLWSRAVEAFERVLEVEPSNKLAASKRNQALSMIDLKDLYEQGERYYNRGQFTQAMELFDRVLAKDPNHVEAKRYLDNSQRQLHLKIEQHFNRGLTYYANEDYDNAIKEWERVLAFNPEHAQSLQYREQARQKLEALQKLMTQ